MGLFDFLKKFATPQALFVEKLIKGEATIEEKQAELKKFGTGLAITAVPVLATIFPAAAAAIAKPVVTTILKKPALAIVGAGLVVSGAAPTVVKTLFRAGEVTGEVITGEKELTAETFKDVAKGAGIVLGLGAAGMAVGVVGKKILEKREEIPTIFPKEIKGLVSEPITPTPPITPETVSLEEPVPLKEPSEARQQHITQRVKVEVGVKQSAHRITQRYLNQPILIK